MTKSTESSPDTSWIDLSHYTAGDYRPGRGKLTQIVWYFVSLLLFESGWFPIGSLKPPILRMFGAKLGDNVTIKPHVKIKYPWRLTIGSHTWIGEHAWIDNLADVRIGSHVCVSQRAYLCTGSHDHRSRGFELKIGEIELHDGCWIATGATILANSTVGANALVAAGSVVKQSVEPAMIVSGVPAQPAGVRQPPQV